MLMAQSLAVSVLKTAQKDRAGAFLEEGTRPTDELMKRFNSQYAVRCMKIALAGRIRAAQQPQALACPRSREPDPEKPPCWAFGMGRPGVVPIGQRELPAVGDNLDLASLREPFDEGLPLSGEPAA